MVTKTCIYLWRNVHMCHYRFYFWARIFGMYKSFTWNVGSGIVARVALPLRRNFLQINSTPLKDAPDLHWLWRKIPSGKLLLETAIQYWGFHNSSHICIEAAGSWVERLLEIGPHETSLCTNPSSKGRPLITKCYHARCQLTCTQAWMLTGNGRCITTWSILRLGVIIVFISSDTCVS